MGRKVKNTVIISGRKFDVVHKNIECLRPLPKEDGTYRLMDIMDYLVKVIPQRDSTYKTVIGLASYLSRNKGVPANESQCNLIIHLINYWKERKVLDVNFKEE